VGPSLSLGIDPFVLSMNFALGTHGPMENNAKKTSTAALNAEIDAIHYANTLYWRQGEAASVEARVEYRRRLDRLEKIRKKLRSAYTKAA
jgi:hypothetical protein